jgi:hypothetical protein
VEIFAPGSGTSIHSYDPGYHPYPGGPLWLTSPGVLSRDNIEIALGQGTASLQFKAVDVFDWQTVPNSFSNGTLLGAPKPATIALEIEWGNPTEDVSSFSDPTNGFEGDFVENEATIKVAVANADGSFRFSGAGDTSSCFAEIGHEQNGVFFDA